jgi:hypothetical protein
MWSRKTSAVRKCPNKNNLKLRKNVGGRIILKFDWILMASCRVQGHGLVSSLINLEFHESRDFLTKRLSASHERLFHGVT